MLKVTIDIHPYGDENSKSTISEIYIGNMGRVSDDPVTIDTKCVYHAWVNYNPSEFLAHARKAPDAIVEHWRSRGAEVLVSRVLEKLDCPNPTKT